jgi:phospholipase C
MASYAEQYYNPPGVHPSEPNYLWLEAGTNFGISNDDAPSENHQGTTQHLVTLLSAASISWKAYQEDISGTVCPLKSTALYAPKHNPMVYFDDVTGGNDPQSASCIAHERPYTELASDLQHNTVARYNFITPNLCDDMHNSLGARPGTASRTATPGCRRRSRRSCSPGPTRMVGRSSSPGTRAKAAMGQSA